MSEIRLTVRLAVDGASPSELRKRFIEAVRAAVIDAHCAGELGTAITEELIRALPAGEPRR